MGRVKTEIVSLFNGALNRIKPIPALVEAIGKNDEEIIEINLSQLDRGYTSTGKSLGRYKNFDYKGRYSPVDLKLHNDFRRKFTVAVNNKQTEIFSQDRKAPILEKRYSVHIYGIQNGNLPRMAEVVQKDFFLIAKRNFTEKR